MENENRDFKTSSNKDLWLFLIVLDVALLGAFGFFLYKHFTAQVFTPLDNAAVSAEVVEDFAPVDTLEVVTAEEENPSLAAQPQEPQAVPLPAEKPLVPQPQPAVTPAPADQPAEVPQAQTPAVQAQTPAKKSVVVTPVNGSKYRRVTFKWFDPADTVSIVSGFTNRKPQPLKKVGDHWETTLSIAPGTYKFLYVINGKNTRDPYSPAKDGRSVVVVE